MASRLDAEPLIRVIRSGKFLNKTLIAICASEGLNKTGVKAEFQQRIIEKLHQYVIRNDEVGFTRLKRNIENPNLLNGAVPSSNSTSSANAHLNVTLGHHSASSMLGQMNGYRGFGGGLSRSFPLLPPASSKNNVGIDFKPSPFYTIQAQVGDIKTCEVMQNHRHTVVIPLRAMDNPALTQVSQEPDYRILAFCAADLNGKQDVAFPHQSEIKVNGGEVKANLRGLKNKPGSTRPVDITKELRLNPPTYTNNVELTYALTAKKFYFVIYVVKNVPVAELVAKLEVGRRITERTVLDEMVTKARDPDIMTTASVLSLKCPLSTLRIELPIRSVTCRHNQCFDGTSYLQLQEQGPTWICPICNNPAPFDNLAVDEYVKNILKNTARSADQVVVQPNGEWDVNAKKEVMSNHRPTGFSDDSDDDLVEVTKTGDSIRMSTPRTMGTPLGLLPGRPRDVSLSSSLPQTNGSISGKRTISAVIDLTSSGDEDEEPLAPTPKRTNVNGFGSYPGGPAW